MSEVLPMRGFTSGRERSAFFYLSNRINLIRDQRTPADVWNVLDSYARDVKLHAHSDMLLADWLYLHMDLATDLFGEGAVTAAVERLRRMCYGVAVKNRRD